MNKKLDKSNKSITDFRNNMIEELKKIGITELDNPSRKNNIYFLMDCSYSMEGKTLTIAKKGAIEYASEAIKKKYSIGLIKFASNATHILESLR